MTNEEIGALVDRTPVEALIAFGVDFWDADDAGPFDEVDEETVRHFVYETVLDGLVDGNITDEEVPSLFDCPNVNVKFGGEER